MSRSTIVIFLLFITACTHAPILVESGECNTKARYSDFDLSKVKVYEKEYWSFLKPYKLSLSDFLAQQNMICSNLHGLRLRFEQNSSDVWMSLAPGASRGRVKLYVLQGEQGPDEDFFQQFD